MKKIGVTILLLLSLLLTNFRSATSIPNLRVVGDDAGSGRSKNYIYKMKSKSKRKMDTSKKDKVKSKTKSKMDKKKMDKKKMDKKKMNRKAMTFSPMPSGTVSPTVFPTMTLSPMPSDSVSPTVSPTYGPTAEGCGGGTASPSTQPSTEPTAIPSPAPSSPPPPSEIPTILPQPSSSPRPSDSTSLSPGPNSSVSQSILPTFDVVNAALSRISEVDMMNTGESRASESDTREVTVPTTQSITFYATAAERAASPEDVEGLLVATEDFYDHHLTTSGQVGDEIRSAVVDVRVDRESILYKDRSGADGLFEMSFDTIVKVLPASTATASDISTAMRTADLSSYVVDYIWKGTGDGQNPFLDADEVVQMGQAIM